MDKHNAFTEVLLTAPSACGISTAPWNAYDLFSVFFQKHTCSSTIASSPINLAGKQNIGMDFFSHALSDSKFIFPDKRNNCFAILKLACRTAYITRRHGQAESEDGRSAAWGPQKGSVTQKNVHGWIPIVPERGRVQLWHTSPYFIPYYTILYHTVRKVGNSATYQPAWAPPTPPNLPAPSPRSKNWTALVFTGRNA